MNDPDGAPAEAEGIEPEAPDPVPAGDTAAGDTVPTDAPAEDVPVRGKVPGATVLPRRFGSSVLMNYVSQGVSGVVSLVVTPLLLHHLGAPAFGIWVLASGVVAYLELFELGFGGSAVKLISEDAYLRPERAVRTTNTILVSLLPLGVLALGVGLVISIFSPELFHLSHGLREQGVITFAVLAFGLAVSIPGDGFGGALGGFQRYDLISLSNTLLGLVSAGVAFAVVFAGAGLVPLAIGTTAASIAFHYVRWRMLKLNSVFPEARLGWRYVERGRLRSVFGQSSWFLVNDLAQTVCSSADIVVVGVIFGGKTTAVYAVGYKLAQVALQALGSLISVFFPHASATARNSEPSALIMIVIEATRLALFASVVPSLVLIVLAFPGIAFWVGPGYGTSSRVLIVLITSFALGSIVSPLNIVLKASGKVRSTSLLLTATAACNLTCSVIFAHLVGPVGVALGTLTGMVVVWLPSMLISGTQMLGLRASTLLRRSALPHLVPALASVAVLEGLRHALGGTLPSMIATAAAGVVTYGAVYFVVSAKPTERAFVIGKVRNLRSSNEE